MTKLLFEINLSGHRLEFINHLYMGMVADHDNDYAIVVPKEFEGKKNSFKWPASRNVRFIHLEDFEFDRVNNIVSPLKRSWRNTLLLRHYISVTKAKRVFLISLMEFLPFLPFMVSRGIEISGIVYLIYLYRWKESSLVTRVCDVLKFAIMSRYSCFKAVYLLSDPVAARRINYLYKTDKYLYIPDPYYTTDYKPKNVREELGIPSHSKMFLHFGTLTRRKGTLMILEAAKLLVDRGQTDFSLVFAGRVLESIKIDFYKKTEVLGKKIVIKVFDQFCSSEFLADLCYTCDFVLVPYSNTSQSSGVLGHAAYYGKPVIGPREGLIGKLIRRNKLGMTIKKMTPGTLAEAMLDIDIEDKLSNNYRELINAKHFVKVVFDRF